VPRTIVSTQGVPHHSSTCAPNTPMVPPPCPTPKVSFNVQTPPRCSNRREISGLLSNHHACAPWWSQQQPPCSSPNEHPSSNPRSFPNEHPSSNPRSFPNEHPSSNPRSFPNEHPSSNPCSFPNEHPSSNPCSFPNEHPSSNLSNIDHPHNTKPTYYLNPTPQTDLWLLLSPDFLTSCQRLLLEYPPRSREAILLAAVFTVVSVERPTDRAKTLSNRPLPDARLERRGEVPAL
jgi:hypothetical protein